MTGRRKCSLPGNLGAQRFRIRGRRDAEDLAEVRERRRVDGDEQPHAQAEEPEGRHLQDFGAG